MVVIFLPGGLIEGGTRIWNAITGKNRKSNKPGKDGKHHPKPTAHVN